MDVHNSSDGNKRKQWAIYIYIYIWNLFEYRKERRSRRVRDDINLLESGSLK